jgi:hypothetical protein
MHHFPIPGSQAQIPFPSIEELRHFLVTTSFLHFEYFSYFRTFVQSPLWSRVKSWGHHQDTAGMIARNYSEWQFKQNSESYVYHFQLQIP